MINMIFNVETIGFAGSGLILTSFLFRKVKTIRTINMFGCALWVVYGSMKGLLPAIILDGSMVVIQLYNLYLLRKQEKEIKKD